MTNLSITKSFLRRCLVATSLAAVGATHQTITAFPVPVHDQITIRHAVGVLPIVLMDARGSTVFASNTNQDGQTKLDLSGLPRGLYAVRVGRSAIKIDKE